MEIEQLWAQQRPKWCPPPRSRPRPRPRMFGHR
jgi:hypothetical protein